MQDIPKTFTTIKPYTFIGNQNNFF